MTSNLDSWSKYTGSNFLKSEHIKDIADAVVVIGVEEITDEDSIRPRIIVEKDQIEYLFDLNITNAKILQGFVKSPRELIGKKLYFKKVNVISPKTNKEVESLRILKIE